MPTRRAFLLATAGLALAACVPPPLDLAPVATPTPRGAIPRSSVTIRIAHRSSSWDLTGILFLPPVRDAVGMPNYGRIYTVQATQMEDAARQVIGLDGDQFDVVTLDPLILGRALGEGMLRETRVTSAALVDGFPHFRSTAYRAVASQNVTRAADLRGRTVTGGPQGEYYDLLLRAWLTQGGLTPGQNVTITPAPLVQVPTLVREERVVLGPYVPPLDGIEVARGSLKDIFLARDVVGPAATLVHVAKQDWLRANEYAFRTFQIDRLRALAWVQGPGRKWAITTMAERNEVSPATYELYFASSRDDYRPGDGCFDPRWLQRPWDVVRQAAGIGGADLAGRVDLAYLPTSC